MLRRPVKHKAARDAPGVGDRPILLSGIGNVNRIMFRPFPRQRCSKRHLASRVVGQAALEITSPERAADPAACESYQHVDPRCGLRRWRPANSPRCHLLRDHVLNADNLQRRPDPRGLGKPFPEGHVRTPPGRQGCLRDPPSCREFDPAGITKLAEMAGLAPGTPAESAVRVAAIKELLDRGFGKATLPISGDAEAPPRLDHFPLGRCGSGTTA